MKALIIFVVMSLASAVAMAEARPVQLPVMYHSTLNEEALYNDIKALPAFTKLDKELSGSAFELWVSHSREPTAAGMAAGLVSAVIMGGSLGLLPGVMNNNLSVTYDLYVHGVRLTSFTYSNNFTDVVNLYAANKTGGLSDAAREWVRSTVARFGVDVAKDKKLKELTEEYSFYFGPQ